MRPCRLRKRESFQATHLPKNPNFRFFERFCPRASLRYPVLAIRQGSSLNIPPLLVRLSPSVVPGPVAALTELSQLGCPVPELSPYPTGAKPAGAVRCMLLPICRYPLPRLALSLSSPLPGHAPNAVSPEHRHARLLGGASKQKTRRCTLMDLGPGEAARICWHAFKTAGSCLTRPINTHRRVCLNACVASRRHPSNG